MPRRLAASLTISLTMLNACDGKPPANAPGPSLSATAKAVQTDDASAHFNFTYYAI